jgi:ribosomal protein S18 acetylase RimI-like enzyme
MRKRSQWKGSCVHAIYQGQIVGQIELRPGDNPDEGYVNLFYLRPDVRDSGFGIELDQYVEEFFRKHKMNCAYLNVSPTNARALRFYEKCGWVKQELITKSGTEVFVMKKIYS